MWFQRKEPLDFEFRGYVRPAPSYEEIARLADAAERLEAAAKRGKGYHIPTQEELDKEAGQAQINSGIRIRVQRLVTNYMVLRAQKDAWKLFRADGSGVPQSLGQTIGDKALHMTVLDTGVAEERLGEIDPTQTKEDIVRRMKEQCPDFFLPTGLVAFDDPELYGRGFRPFVALPVSRSANRIHDQKEILRQIVASNPRESGNRSHTSLGTVSATSDRTVGKTFHMLREGITPRLPVDRMLEYGPPTIEVTYPPKR